MNTAQTVEVAPNPFGPSGFVALITSGRLAGRAYIGDGRSTFGLWDTREAAIAAATRYGYVVTNA